MMSMQRRMAALSPVCPSEVRQTAARPSRLIEDDRYFRAGRGVKREAATVSNILKRVAA